MSGLLEQHVAEVYRFALRLTRDCHRAEEIAQETFLRACRHHRRLREPKAARVWLLRIALNLWRDQLRQEKRRPQQVSSSLDEQCSPTTPPDREATDREDVQLAMEAMDWLPSRQREVLCLHACQQLSLAEIAEVLQLSPEAVKASLSLARKKMRRWLNDLCPDRYPKL